jgi:hypothetical protein
MAVTKTQSVVTVFHISAMYSIQPLKAYIHISNMEGYAVSNILLAALKAVPSSSV